MKRFKIVIIFFFFVCISFSQSKEWNSYDLDSIVKLDMPFEVYEIDTIINNRKHYEIFSDNDSITFYAKKSFLGKAYSNVESLTLPNDQESLTEFYSDLTWFITEGNKNELARSIPIKYHNLKGYKLIFKNKSGLHIQELNLVLANKHLYSFSYTNINGLKEEEKNMFFNSISFNDNNRLWQIPEKSMTLRYIMIGLFIFLLLSFLLRQKSKIN